MITTKQRSYLKSLAHHLQPIFQIGKGGISENVIIQYEEAFETKELIKTSVLNNSEFNAKEACELIAEKTHADIVQVIGSKFVLYRPSRKNRKIELPVKKR
ncbi:MAG: ribosome assembly RNA-binding protein YhbY [Clostridia bacterium]|nr:ribosome assembly RNA-binding protein YhbY [Clostridia bacterium]